MASVAGMLLSGLAAYLVLSGEGRWAGVSAGLAGVALVIGTVAARRRSRPLALFLDSAGDRAFDGCLLSAIALAARPAEPLAAGAAAVALVVSFVAAYERARGQALGYPVEDGLVSRIARYGLVTLGLAWPRWLAEALLVLVGLTVLSSVVRATQVVKKERE
jgi:hypothetical protein